MTGLAVAALLLLSSTVAGAREKPQQTKSQVAFGVDMAQRGLWSEALFRFRQAEKMGDTRASVMNNIAVAYEALGRFDRAQEYYKKKGLDADPRNPGVKRNYSRFVEFYQSFKPDEPAQPPREDPAPAAGVGNTPTGEVPSNAPSDVPGELPGTADEPPTATDPAATPTDPS